MGSVTMELLLRACPDVRKVLLLIRSKGGKSGARALQLPLSSHGHWSRLWSCKGLYGTQRSRKHMCCICSPADCVMRDR